MLNLRVLIAISCVISLANSHAMPGFGYLHDKLNEHVGHDPRRECQADLPTLSV